jgi:hypothetical protein
MSLDEVNTVSDEELQEFWNADHKWLSQVERTLPDGTKNHFLSCLMVLLGSRRIVQLCSLKSTKPNGHPQVSVARFMMGRRIFHERKPLVHALWWRWNNRDLTTGICPQIDLNLDLSHVDTDSTSLNCVQESHERNESRKYCKLFGWYKVAPGEGTCRCPHWESPCSGPEDQ